MHAKSYLCYSYANNLSSVTILAKLALPSNRSPMHLNARKKLQQLKQKNPSTKWGNSGGKTAKAQTIKEACAARTTKSSSLVLSEILPDWSSSSHGRANGKNTSWVIEYSTHGQRDLIVVVPCIWRSSHAWWSFEIGRHDGVSKSGRV